ncbi:hypothetical protein [Streptomyces scabiei]|uniref:hypothetical protein n=1 Tax=Streptomyces scabiei TaxID=1930 RepID=UPI000B02058D|nr:hypothetical protein [Streptomyces scabiei]
MAGYRRRQNHAGKIVASALSGIQSHPGDGELDRRPVGEGDQSCRGRYLAPAAGWVLALLTGVGRYSLASRSPTRRRLDEDQERPCSDAPESEVGTAVGRSSALELSYEASYGEIAKYAFGHVRVRQ